MKFLLAFCLALIALVASAQSVPLDTFLEDEALQEIGNMEQGTDAYDYGNEGVRQKRVTCDLMGISTPWGSLNHAACAAHCLTMGKGFKGDRCSKGVCKCRR
ncbi:tenecin-1-like [Ctenocephalides felis]|uniref:tenecin-1-like n=1 Tax=Ctenocephalides felis TaxID=7515 RepID=UPI000E6E1664|nr:tenecin-1-like [Ctenocephalides felis]